MENQNPSDRLSKSPADSAVETRFLLMPSQANPYGTAFGGAIVAEIDMTASMAAQRHCEGLVVTAAIDSIQFEQPIFIGDQVVLRASVNYAGRTSMEVGVQVIRENPLRGESIVATTAHLTFVAVDEKTKQPIPVPAIRPETDEEKRRCENARLRVQARKDFRKKMKQNPNKR